MSKKIRLLIADDHAIMREGLKQLFVLAGDLQVVAEAENGAMVLERLQRGGVDLLLLDMNMPGISGAELVTHISARYPDQKMLVLSVHNEPQIAQHILRAGATGYLCKMCSLSTLLDAIRRVAGGMRFIDPQIAERIAFEVSGLKQHSHHHTLTEREFQILLLFARGTSVTRIAETLSISHKTVSTHKSRLMEKMGFSSNAEIVRFAVSQHLID
ncbi:response regulator transcription factor [Pseudomonas sp. B21-028]|jgi:DNA-binding NarL/FixJ family response regulator|uniref:response regulator n=1 Tax=Pseudomonas sp. B21-028 TaxID=2895480 RepID=UPI0021600361|nr:response regulator transcription factor [Pseudomonas sp. B21-028]UVL86473.1 response regulator transcription factor [Pseudomonas sp. B21-028]